jgi:hypothetical protein
MVAEIHARFTYRMYDLYSKVFKGTDKMYRILL